MLLKPIIPFEPMLTEHIPLGENWVSQIKWDGVRVLTYYDGNEIQLFNRKKNERTLHYPELLNIKSYCKAKSVILDGEIISLGADGKPSFHEVMRRDGIRRTERVKYIQKSIPISYMIFDVIFYNNQWLSEISLRERIELLDNIITPNEQIQLVDSHQNSKVLFDVIVQQGMEGIIIKDLDSKYYINSKNRKWQKKKNYLDINAVIGGVTFRDGFIISILLGLFDGKGDFWFVGYAGTGKLREADLQKLTKMIKPLIIESHPFVNQPKGIKDVTWIKPKITVKIQFVEWTEGGSFRQPIIQAIVDVPLASCRF